MPNQAKLFRSLGGLPLLTFAVSLLGVPLCRGALAQTAEVLQATSTSAAVIPQQVRYAGALSNRAGETVEAVFKIYATAEGGEALWSETQKVSVGADGSYSVLLGAANESGLPQAVFAGGQARWVGVTIDRSEGVRSPLSSVAYAMKAGDAESVGGVAAANLVTKDELAKLTQATAVVQTQPQGIQQAVTPTGSGTADYVALWTAAGNLGNSNIFQASSGFLGIGTTTPGGPLELATGATGGANATLMLEQTSAASGNYYADLGLYNSHGLIGNLSALGAGYPAGAIYGANDVVFLGGQQNATTNVLLLTNTGGALKFGTGGYAKTDERLRIGSAGGVSIGNSYVVTDPGAGNLIVSGKVGVGTTAPSANLEVNGTAKFDGLITFASGQTFPGGSGGGTITGITTSSPLTGSGTSGTVALGLSTSALETTLNSVYAQLGQGDAFTGYTTFSGGVAASSAAGSAFAALQGLGTNGTTGLFGSSDTGVGVYGSSSHGYGVYGSSSLGSAGFFTNSAESSAALYATNSANFTASNGFSPTALQGVSTGTDSVGVIGEGTLFGVWGFTTTKGSTGVQGGASDGYAGYFSNSGADYAAVYAGSTAAGSPTTDPTAFSAMAVGTNAYGVYSNVTGNGAYAVIGVSNGDIETTSGSVPVGVAGATSGNDTTGVVGQVSGTGSIGVVGFSEGGPDTKNYAPVGVYGYASGGTGVEGFAVSPSKLFGVFQTAVAGAPYTAGVWGDTSGSAINYDLAGVVGTADDERAGYFENNSASSQTLTVINVDAGNGGPTGLFKVFKASTPNGTCGIGDGDLSCTGQLKTLATTGGGARTVETYATQSAENWMEDYGTGLMERGAGVVQIDPAFAETVTADAKYHVFLTPHGDSKGLYVTNLTPTSFEVRESGGGVSSLSFDYKIVGKRRGYEAQRLVDVTDRFKAEQLPMKGHMPSALTTDAPGRVMRLPVTLHPGNVAQAAALRNANVKPGGGVVLPTPVVPKTPGSAVKPVAKPM